MEGLTVKEYTEERIAEYEREKGYHTVRQNVVVQEKQAREAEKVETQEVLDTVEAGPKAKGELRRRIRVLDEEIHRLDNEGSTVAGRVGDLSSLVGQLKDLRDLL